MYLLKKKEEKIKIKVLNKRPCTVSLPSLKKTCPNILYSKWCIESNVQYINWLSFEINEPFYQNGLQNRCLLYSFTTCTAPPPKKVFLHKKIHFHKNRKKQNISRTQKELYEKKITTSQLKLTSALMVPDKLFHYTHICVM